MATLRYTCTNCGDERTEVNAARPSIDDRYAIGTCIGCSGSDPDHAIERQLIRRDLYDPALLRNRRERSKTQRLLKKVYVPAVRHANAAGVVPSLALITDQERDAARQQVVAWFEEAEKRESESSNVG